VVVGWNVGKPCPSDPIEIEVALTSPLVSVCPMAVIKTPVCKSDIVPLTVFWIVVFIPIFTVT
jgi:hypothetical protein